MANSLVGFVYDGFPEGGNTFSVILALADGTNEQTGRCDPSVEYIAWKTRISERSVQYAIKSLVADKWIRVEANSGQKRTNQYILNVKKLSNAASTRKQEFNEMREKKNAKSYLRWDSDYGVESTTEDSDDMVQDMHPIKEERVQEKEERVQNEALEGATVCTQTIEPLKEPLVNIYTGTPTPSDKSEERKFQHEDIINRAFLYYCKRLGRSPTRYSLTDTRKKKAISRLKERESMVGLQQAMLDIKVAIDNLADNDYLVSGGYIDWLGQIFKSSEEFEKRLNWKPSTYGGQKSEQQNQLIGNNRSGLSEWLIGKPEGYPEEVPSGQLYAQVRPLLE